MKGICSCLYLSLLPATIVCFTGPPAHLVQVNTSLARKHSRVPSSPLRILTTSSFSVRNIRLRTSKISATSQQHGASQNYNIQNKSNTPWRHKKTFYKRKRNNRKTKKNITERLRSAEKTEAMMSQAIDDLQTSEKLPSNKHSLRTSFPSVRDCNGAIAAFGDASDFKRALALFRQMRKAVTLLTSYNRNSNDLGRESMALPSPTLVTYSTLMSRAVGLGKERVALRLWRLMILQTNFFANCMDDEKSDCTYDDNGYIEVKNGAIIPDIRAVNILMNAFAKIGDDTHAKMLMDQLYTGDVAPFDVSTEVGDDEGLLRVVPRMKPNIVTYNTLIDAYHRAGDLDAALETLEHLKMNTELRPDAMTYTSLISTVARRDTKSSGKRDPDLAFALFEEMVNRGINPNGMTFSALIDVCGRCRRSDLALKGLRMMLREKTRRKRHAIENNYFDVTKSGQKQQFVLYNEVGAWTATIDACGKAGRIDTALRLFYKMPNFDVKPNTVTCGALTDCLLKSNSKNNLAETLKVLRYMKAEGMEPTEVMYTSLITSASNLAKTENEERGEIVLPDFGDGAGSPARISSFDETIDADFNESSESKQTTKMMKALDIYTELLVSMTTNLSSNVTKEHGSTPTENLLVKVFLVLQEMKASGSNPDIACYNALLKACATAQDVSRMRSVLRRIEREGLVPNSKSWREILRGASIIRDSALAEEMWEMALTYKDSVKHLEANWYPEVEHFELLLSSYSREAFNKDSAEEKAVLYRKIVDSYLAVANLETRSGFDKIDIDEIHQNHKIVKMTIQAAAFVDNHFTTTNKDEYENQHFQDSARQTYSELMTLKF